MKQEFVKMFVTVEQTENGLFIHTPEIVEQSVGVTDAFNDKLIKYLDIDLNDQNIIEGAVDERGDLIE